MTRRVRGRRIGFIPQDPYLALNPVFKIGAQLLAVLRWHAPPQLRTERDRRAHLVSLLRRVQIPDAEAVLERYPHQFSGGQRQRLMIAGALACSPALVIADEPTTALDVTTQLQILKLLKSLTEEFGIAMLFVTHDFGVVAQLCDDITVMYAGQTVEAGPTPEVLADPRHPYTRALLACHPDRSDALTGIPAWCRRRSAPARLPLRAALPARRRGLQPTHAPHLVADAPRPPRQLPPRRRAAEGARMSPGAPSSRRAMSSCCSAGASAGCCGRPCRRCARWPACRSRCARARRWASSASPAAARPRSGARCSASSARPAGEIRLDGKRRQRPAARCRPSARGVPSSTCTRMPAPPSIRGGASAASSRRG